MRANPYQLVEGVLIAAYAVGAVGVFICLKASFDPELEAITRAVREIQAAGICRDCPVKTACLEYALANHIDHGVWGGTSERERRRIARRRRVGAGPERSRPPG